MQYVDMSIYEARYSNAVLQVDYVCILWDFCFGQRANVRNSIIFDNHRLCKVTAILVRRKDPPIAKYRCHDNEADVGRFLEIWGARAIGSPWDYSVLKANPAAMSDDDQSEARLDFPFRKIRDPRGD